MKLSSVSPIAAVLLHLLGAAHLASGEDEDQHHQHQLRDRKTTQRSGNGYGSGYTPPSYTMALFGDWPYSQTLLDNHMLLVDSVNADNDIDVVVHVGDIHSGSMPCTGAGYNGIATVSTVSSGIPSTATLPVINPQWNVHVYDAFQKFESPVVYTPGDNEWTDCHKSKQYSSGAPLAELQGVRELFFSPPGRTLGKEDKTVFTQAWSSVAADQAYVENVMWHESLITFATFNIPGGSNDDSEVSAPWTGVYKDLVSQQQERLARESANLRWLNATFDAAIRKRSRAVVLMTQADMWDPEKATDLTNYSPFVQLLAARALAYQKPVLLVNGDSHVYKVDQPLVSNNAATNTYALGCDTSSPPTCDLSKIHNVATVPNLLRIVVEGSSQPGPLNWSKLTIRPLSSGVFNVFTYASVCYTNCV